MSGTSSRRPTARPSRSPCRRRPSDPRRGVPLLRRPSRGRLPGSHRGPARRCPPGAAGGREQRAHLGRDQPAYPQPALRAGSRRALRRRSGGSARRAARRVRIRPASARARGLARRARLPPRRAWRRQPVLPRVGTLCVGLSLSRRRERRAGCLRSARTARLRALQPRAHRRSQERRRRRAACGKLPAAVRNARRDARSRGAQLERPSAEYLLPARGARGEGLPDLLPRGRSLGAPRRGPRAQPGSGSGSLGAPRAGAGDGGAASGRPRAAARERARAGGARALSRIRRPDDHGRKPPRAARGRADGRARVLTRQERDLGTRDGGLPARRGCDRRAGTARVDAAVQRMVVIGHSQGGLLTKTTVVDSGDAFWQNVSRKPLDELKISEAGRDLLRRALFVHPLPFVRRVVFVATPHRGSYIAGSWIAQQVAKLVRAPLDVTRVVTELVTLNEDALAVEKVRGAPTAVDNMTPGNRFVRTLVQLPIAAGVTAHSIIPIKGDGTPAGQNDGVVDYDSAHIDGVASEVVVVRQDHSCQSNPHTIAEIRRILLEHLETP